MKFLFAWRYFKSKKTTNAINIIAWISVLAIAVGTAALVIVLSVFNGFEDLVKTLYGDFYADIKVAPATGKFFSITDKQFTQINKTAGIAHTSMVVEEKAVLVNGDYQTILFLKGVDSAYKDVNKLQDHIVRGKYEMGTAAEPAVVIGVGIENAVGADPESLSTELALYLPNRKANSLASLDGLHSFNVNVRGTFMVQQEFDNKYAFTNLGFMQYMLDLQPNQYSAIEVSVNNPRDIDKVKKQLQQALGQNFVVQTRLEQNQGLFTVMQMEKWVIYGILSLILIVAAFNMIGALTMLVLEKQKDIAVLKAMGANNNLIQQIFLGEGFVLAGIGTGAGLILAFLVCWVQLKFKLVKLEGGSFIIDYYPVKMLATDFLLVMCTIALVTILAAWLPSRKAAMQEFSLKS